MNTAEFVAIAQSICPDRDGLAFEGRRWTFAELDDRANRLANALDGLGVTRGDRVCMLDVNGPRYVEAYFAVAKRGAIFVPLNFRATAAELRYMISHAEDTTILMYTSGTTGRPKGVPLRHDALVTYVLDHVDAADPDLEERNILTVPPYHRDGMQG